jgi:conjugative relaxase-like TrwC/TraI family protein
VLRVYVTTSEARAKSYFREGFAREDYYTEGQEVVGRWGGRAAEMLGLEGKVDRESFYALCENRSPLDGEKLTLRSKSKRRVGYDWTFSVPKSVSLVLAITNDRRIIEAFEESVDATMREMEKDAMTRVRKHGQDHDRPTQNLVWAQFMHHTSRPEKDPDHPGQFVVDPHLHKHVYAFNCTYDSVEKCWKAGQFGGMVQDAAHYEAMFENMLAGKLREMGYPTIGRGKSFEIAGIPRPTIKQFSQRTNAINEYAEEHGITDPKEKGALGARTRRVKMKDIPMSELRKSWEQRMDPAVRQKIWELHEVSMGRRDRTAGEQGDGSLKSLLGEQQFNGGFRTADGRAEQEALNFAILHCFERQSVVDERKLMTVALQFGVGTLNIDKLRELVRTRVDLLRMPYRGREYLTTPEVVAEEQAMIEWVRNGKGVAMPLAPRHVIRDQRLNDHQRAAVTHVLESRDLVTGVNGRAGTGKSFAMKEAIDAMKSRGHRVFVFAPTAEAARDILRREGFEQAETVAQLLTSERLQELSKGAVWWIDESGLVSARDMSRVAKLARESHARVVLSGDTRQHRAVQRGDALRVLEVHAGLEVATVGRIQRQEGLYRDAVEDLSNGKIVDAFDKLDQLQAIREIDTEDRYLHLAKEYLLARHDDASALIVSPTHFEIRRVTAIVRHGLKEDGFLGNERNFELLSRVDTTEATRADVRTYEEGILTATGRQGTHVPERLGCRA